MPIPGRFELVVVGGVAEADVVVALVADLGDEHVRNGCAFEQPAHADVGLGVSSAAAFCGIEPRGGLEQGGRRTPSSA